MKKRIGYVLSVLSILIGCGQNPVSEKSAFVSKEQQSEFISKVEPLIADYMSLDIFSGVVLIADSGKIIFHKAYGLADRDTEKPNELNTLFDIGSMNKTFTRIVVKQLEEEDKLKLTDKLIDYIPGFKDERAKDITVNHLLEHSSGFGDYHNEGYFDLPLEERTLNSIVERAKDYKLHFSPGDGDAYSNLGYVILGKIIEEVSDKSYFENVNDRIVAKLGLKNTFLNDFKGLESRIAKGYLYSPLGALEENSSIQDIPNPDGGFLSTTEDIQKFYHSYYFDTTLVSDSSKEADPYFQYLKDLPKGKAASAAGGFEGFNSVYLQILDPDLSIIVFANMDEPVAERIGLDILALYRGEEIQKPSLPAIQNVRINFEEKGIDYVEQHFDSLTVNFHPTDPKDFILNDLGYAYLYGANNPDNALQIFKLNTKLFPEVANCWDSYGEALRIKGMKNEAISAYEKALEIRPDLQSSQMALDELKQ